MRAILHFGIFLGLNFFVSSFLYAQTSNGCGSGWSRPFVPDKIQFLGCYFKKACDQHDYCYGACESETKSPECEYLRCKDNGDLVGEPICDSVQYRDLREKSEKRKKICDLKFAEDLAQSNRGNGKCLFFAWLYPKAVQLFGSSSFVGIDPGSVSLSQDDVDLSLVSINNFITNASTEELQNFQSRIDNGTQVINFSRPLHYNKSKGLFN